MNIITVHKYNCFLLLCCCWWFSV